MSSTVGIVGSAGRKDDGRKMTHNLYVDSITKTKEIIQGYFELPMKKVRLISGGAAWADHIAVDMFLNGDVAELTLNLPAKWVKKPTPQFEDNKQPNQKNPGRMANKYHKEFSKRLGKDTLVQLQEAMDAGATVKVHKGFQERNKAIAKSSRLIAFTWGDGEEPKPGGTLQTWKLCGGQKVHVPFSSFVKPYSGDDNPSKLARKRTCSESSVNLDKNISKPCSTLFLDERIIDDQLEAFDHLVSGEDVYRPDFSGDTHSTIHVLCCSDSSTKKQDLKWKRKCSEVLDNYMKTPKDCCQVVHKIETLDLPASGKSVLQPDCIQKIDTSCASTVAPDNKSSETHLSHLKISGLLSESSLNSLDTEQASEICCITQDAKNKQDAVFARKQETGNGIASVYNTEKQPGGASTGTFRLEQSDTEATPISVQHHSMNKQQGGTYSESPSIKYKQPQQLHRQKRRRPVQKGNKNRKRRYHELNFEKSH